MVSGGRFVSGCVVVRVCWGYRCMGNGRVRRERRCDVLVRGDDRGGRLVLPVVDGFGGGDG